MDVNLLLNSGALVVMSALGAWIWKDLHSRVLQLERHEYETIQRLKAIETSTQDNGEKLNHLSDRLELLLDRCPAPRAKECE